MATSVKLYKGIGSKQDVKTVTYPSSAYDKAVKDGFKVHADSKSAFQAEEKKQKSGGSTTTTSTKTTTTSTPSKSTTTSKSTSSTPSPGQTAADLSSYYAATGKSLPAWNQRFSDPAFAAAARAAGISQTAYTGSPSQNTAILNALKSGGSASPTPSTGTPSPGTSTTPGASTPPKAGTPSTGTTPSKPEDAAYGGSSAVYPMGNYSLVRFQGQGPSGYMNENTIWLVDPSTKTLRPFSNSSALENFFDGEVDIDQIVVMSAADLMPGGALGTAGTTPGFQILSNDYAIKPDGSAKRLDYSNAQLSTRYGQPVNEELEQDMYSALKGVMKQLETAGIKKSELNKIKNNDDLMAYYVSAMAYGGYSVGDIYSDVKRRELGINNLSPISATANKAAYADTNEYQKASGDDRIMPPVEFAGMNSAQLDLPVYQLPDEAFKTLIPIMDYESQEFKDAMDAVETSYYDVLEQQLRASTEQEKAVADYNYNEWKSEVERNFGIQLSDNALEAWNQIQQSYGDMAGRGIMNSGIQNEGIDTYLRRVRQIDQRVRDEKLTNEEKQQMNYYLSAATPQQIKDLIAAEPDKARSWGLIPSDEVKQAMSLSALKEKYPNAKEEDLAQYIAILFDENGNYRSQIYQNQMGTLGDLDPNSASMNNLTGLGTAKEQFQRSEALRKSLLEEEDAYKEFTTPDVAFLRNTDSDAFADVTGTKASKDNINLKSIIKQAGGNLKTNLTTTPQATGTQYSSSQLAGMRSQLEQAQAAINKLNGTKTTTTTKTPVYNPTTVSSTPTSSKGMVGATQGPVQGPIQPAKPTQSFISPTAKYTAPTSSGASSTSGSSGKGILSKLKFW